jgi:chemotaxis protein MotB
MTRFHNRRHSVEHDNVDRWLVSYADYMTLLFALFVVLYAMALVNEKSFESVTDSIGKVFQADNEKTKNKGHGDDVLLMNESETTKKIYGNAILASGVPARAIDIPNLTEVNDVEIGTSLKVLKGNLSTALYNIVESGQAQLQIDGEWLEIELNSGVLFASGSSSPTKSAISILSLIGKVIESNNNYFRIRGYTDNDPINNEIFSSNWELSVYRATSILRVFESLKIASARMAIEGYGQYYPSADNTTEEGRAKNRRVVIAISKYSLQNTTVINTSEVSILKELTNTIKKDKDHDALKLIESDNGGIVITTRNDGLDK